jgi:hypothetical protein
MPSELDLAEIRFIRQVSLKSEARRFLEKSACTPYCESPLKLRCQLVRLLAIWKQTNDAQSSVSGLFSLHTAVGNGAINKFGICFQWRNEHCKPRMLVFSAYATVAP